MPRKPKPVDASTTEPPAVAPPAKRSTRSTKTTAPTRRSTREPAAASTTTTGRAKRQGKAEPVAEPVDVEPVGSGPEPTGPADQPTRPTSRRGARKPAGQPAVPVDVPRDTPHPPQAPSEAQGAPDGTPLEAPGGTKVPVDLSFRADNGAQRTVRAADVLDLVEGGWVVIDRRDPDRKIRGAVILAKGNVLPGVRRIETGETVETLRRRLAEHGVAELPGVEREPLPARSERVVRPQAERKTRPDGTPLRKVVEGRKPISTDDAVRISLELWESHGPVTRWKLIELVRAQGHTVAWKPLFAEYDRLGIAPGRLKKAVAPPARKAKAKAADPAPEVPTPEEPVVKAKPTKAKPERQVTPNLKAPKAKAKAKPDATEKLSELLTFRVPKLPTKRLPKR